MLHRPRHDVVDHELDRLLDEMTQQPSYCQLELRALLRQFRDDTYEIAYNKGYDHGYEVGCDDKCEKVYNEGYSQGYVEGKLHRDD